jgi:hypothetical protein
MSLTGNARRQNPDNNAAKGEHSKPTPTSVFLTDLLWDFVFSGTRVTERVNDFETVAFGI